MQLLHEPLPGVYELQHRIIEDTRGSFTETFNQRVMNELGIDHPFCQDNESYSAAAGTVRGLHLQTAPHAQGKLVRVLHGSVFDVAVDVRPDSPTFRQHATVELTAGDHRAFWIPPGFAHGFCTLVDDTVVAYKVTDFYAPDAERTIHYDDPDLAIDWPVTRTDAVLSPRDAAAPSLATYLNGTP